MRFVLAHDREPYGMKRELVNSGYLTETDCLVAFDESELSDPQRKDCVLVLVDEFAAISDALTMIELAIEDRICNLMVITRYDLTDPRLQQLVDRWEHERLDELLSNGRIVICDIQQDWRSLIGRFAMRAKGG